MFLSRTLYTSNGTQQSYVFNWPYLLSPHVFVLVRPGPLTQWVQLVSGQDWNLTSTNTVQLATAPPLGYELMIRRSTPNTDLIDRLTAPSTVSADELNTISTQLLYLIQEALDSGLSFEGSSVGEFVDEFIKDARFGYDFHFVTNALLGVGEVIGPVVAKHACTIPEDSQALISALNLPSSPHSWELIHKTASGSAAVGFITLSPTGAVTTNLAGDINISPGDSLHLVTVTSGPSISGVGVVLSSQIPGGLRLTSSSF